MTGTKTQDWWTFLLTDPSILGAVSWVGLLVTIAGFWIALVQISKIKTASQAAKDAVVGAIGVVRSQEQSGRLSAAIKHLLSAKLMVQSDMPEAVTAHVEIAWSILIEARELAETASDQSELEFHVIALRRLVDEVGRPGRASDRPLSKNWHASINDALSKIETMSARNRMKLSGIGGDR